ncbi:MAG: N-acetyltransferase [Sphingobacteriales bacterium]|nr:MAG: N-acetyltransferase [Sphingobacteriales bacterium]
MIETTRLIIKPLTYDQLVTYLRADNFLEREFDLHDSVRPISPELKEAFEQTFLPNVADPGKNYLYCTLWTVIDKKEKRMVADLCFAGEPNSQGEIEIGYGTYENQRNKGYITEAVGGMIKWAGRQQAVKVILASTDKANSASCKVLENNRFIRIDENEHLYHWKLVLNDIL